MATWGEFAAAEPELAAFGAERLLIPPAYLATVRRSGAPRVHPVTPREPTSPKGRDLRERGGFAMHNGVPDDEGTGGEFFCSGLAFAVEDPSLRALVTEAARFEPEPRYVLFELQLTEARCNGYGDVKLPAHRRWPAAT